LDEQFKHCRGDTTPVEHLFLNADSCRPTREGDNQTSCNSNVTMIANVYF